MAWALFGRFCVLLIFMATATAAAQDYPAKSLRLIIPFTPFVPAGTPRDIVLKLNAAVTKVLGQQDFKAQLAREGLDPAGGTPEAFDGYFRAEVEKLAAVIKASGAKAE